MFSQIIPIFATLLIIGSQDPPFSWLDSSLISEKSLTDVRDPIEKFWAMIPETWPTNLRITVAAVVALLLENPVVISKFRSELSLHRLDSRMACPIDFGETFPAKAN